MEESAEQYLDELIQRFLIKVAAKKVGFFDCCRNPRDSVPYSAFWHLSLHKGLPAPFHRKTADLVGLEFRKVVHGFSFERAETDQID